MLLFLIGPDPITAAPHTNTGPAPRVDTSGLTAESFVSASTMNAAFAVDVYPNERLGYIPNTAIPGDWINVGDVAGTTYFAGDFVGHDFSQLYVIDYSLNELHSLNTNTGTATTIGACTPLPGHVWTGATGTSGGILYASSTNDVISTLYTINTTTGTASVVGQITNAPVIIDIAINAAGAMYGVDISSDRLIKINPATGAGSVIGSIGYTADYAQGMDFEHASGVLYLAAYNTGTARGELRIANTTTGNSVLVGAFPEGAQTDALAFTPSPSQLLQNPGFESGWAYWHHDLGPFLSNTSHDGSWSVYMSGEECWVWQEVFIPSDALDVTFGYWVTGLSADSDGDDDILYGGIWNSTRQFQLVDLRFGLTYFLYYPMTWKNTITRLTANELAFVAGQKVLVAFRLKQDWNPGYHKTSSAYIDDAVLYVTRPVYDYGVYLPMAVR